MPPRKLLDITDVSLTHVDTGFTLTDPEDVRDLEGIVGRVAPSRASVQITIGEIHIPDNPETRAMMQAWADLSTSDCVKVTCEETGEVRWVDRDVLAELLVTGQAELVLMREADLLRAAQWRERYVDAILAGRWGFMQWHPHR